MTSVVGYLPELRKAVNPFGPIEAITIRQLLSHQSGLRVDPAGTDWSVPSYQPEPGADAGAPGRDRVQAAALFTCSINTLTWPTSCSARS